MCESALWLWLVYSRFDLIESFMKDIDNEKIKLNTL